ncbi:MAG: hypothetical protein ACLFR1_14870 [Spirochaetia bacterium]
MNQQIEQMIAAYRTGVENAVRMANNDSVTAKIQSVYNELISLGEKYGDDFMGFVTEANGSGLFTRLSSEMAAVNQAIQEQQADESTRKELSKDDILETYKSLLEQMKTKPFLYETVKAYEDMIALADEYDSYTAWQRAAWEKGIMRRLGFMPTYDTAKLEYDKTDPNEIFDREIAREQMEIALEAYSGDQMNYLTVKTSNELKKKNAADEIKQSYCWTLFYQLQCFTQLKNRIRSGVFLAFPIILYAFKEFRQEIAGLYNFMKDHWGLDFDTIINTPRYFKKLFYHIRPLQGSDRIFFCEDPNNANAYREVLFEEVLSDKSFTEILLRKQRTPDYETFVTDEHTADYNVQEMRIEEVKKRAGKYYWIDYSLEVLDKSMKEYYAFLKTHKAKWKNRKPDPDQAANTSAMQKRLQESIYNQDVPGLMG